MHAQLICPIRPLAPPRWLTKPNPQDRPTAREVLASDLLPPRVLDEQVGPVPGAMFQAAGSAAAL